MTIRGTGGHNFDGVDVVKASGAQTLDTGGDMKRGHTRRLALAVGVVAAIVVASSAAWIGSQRATASSGAVATPQAGGSGILRIGTTSYIDSFNPWNYIEGQGLNAMVMVYPLLVQLDYTKEEGYVIAGDWAKSWKASNGGKTWTFKLRPNTKWSDGKAMTADDAAWTINTTIKYGEGATAVLAASVNHAKRASAPNTTTLVLKYSAPVANALWLIGRTADRAQARLGAAREEGRRPAARSRRTARRTSCRWSRAARTR